MRLLLSSVAGQPDPDIVIVPYVFAAVDLSLDYLFMPVYTLTLAFGTLLASERCGRWLKPLGAAAGYQAHSPIRNP